MSKTFMFTIEEMGVLAAVQHENRMAAVSEISRLIPAMDSPELKEISLRTREKLKGMTDEDYLKVDFAAYEDDLRNAEV